MILGSSKGYCAQYNGKICRKYLNASILIWFNNTLENEGSEQNEIITTGLWDEMLPSFSKTCRPAAEVYILYVLDIYLHSYNITNRIKILSRYFIYFLFFIFLETAMFVCISPLSSRYLSTTLL